MAPIVFTARGFDLDTRLWVLGEEYHVHSALLKQKSEFFFKFMDSPDKTPNLDSNSAFKYEWVSYLDDDYDAWSRTKELKWFLRAKDTMEPMQQIVLADDYRKPELAAFHALLCAMYGLPYTIAGEGRLGRIVKLADYYRALPTVSYTVTAAMDISFRTSICGSRMAEYACKLHHVGLLQEFVVKFAGLRHHADERYQPVKSAYEDLSSDIKTLVDKAVASIDGKLGRAHRRVIEFEWPAGTKPGPFRETCENESMYEYYDRIYKSYRALYIEDPSTDDYIKEVLMRQRLEELVGRNLELDRSRMFSLPWAVKVFFCGDFDRENLPWETKLDW